MTSSDIEIRLLGILEKADSLLPKGELSDMIDLVRAGEPGIGLENFCMQLFERDVKAPPEILKEIASLGSAMGLRAQLWERLK
jgi:hypothetical protein